MQKLSNERKVNKIRTMGNNILCEAEKIPKKLNFIVIKTPEMRYVFDEACEEIHYAGACQRVGRCMRLAITYHNEWIGGIVLGSTFPNIKARDEAFGLTKYTKGYKKKGLVSPWARENKAYWDRLQLIVNHARTFIFPKFQGNGLGIASLSLLLTTGRRIWEERYNVSICGFDTLCTHPTSRLFKDNRWKLVGQTRGYSRDPYKLFSKRAFKEEWKNIKDNAGLCKIKGNMQWWIWVKVFKNC